MKTKSALSYFGSDSAVAEGIASLLDHCRHVTIGFVGGAAILPHLKAKAIVANDKHAMAINFYRCLSGHFGEVAQLQLIERCHNTLSHPEEIELAARFCEQPDMSNTTSQAWAFWALCWLGRKGKGGTKHMGGQPSVRRTANGGNNANRIAAAAADLEAWAQHFKRCEWQQTCFRELHPKVADRADCGLYDDPPWIGAGRNYLHSFTEQDYRDLAELHNRFEHTTVVLRINDAPLIHELYPQDRWEWITAESRNQANKICDEVWITNRKGKAD
jgi:site-specific DNA-adenine methylase